MAKWHDELLAAKDPVLTLRLAGGLCLLALLSNIFRCSCLPAKACQFNLESTCDCRHIKSRPSRNILGFRKQYDEHTDKEGMLTSI